jgi:benzoylformate decarboxylase
VFLSLPVDVQSATADFDLTPQRPIDWRVRPPVGELKRAAEVLSAAENPAILAGNRIVEADGVGELLAVADLLGAPMISDSATTHGRLSFPSNHPLAASALPTWAPEIEERLNEFDVLFVVGMDLLQLYVYFEPDRAIPKHARIVHLDQNIREIGKNFPTEVGVVGDPKSGLGELAEILRGTMTTTQRERAGARGERHQADHQRQYDELCAQAETEKHERPLTSLSIIAALARALPDDAAVIEEAVTTTNTTLERMGAIKDPTGYFGQHGWALGWGLGCSIGVKLAWPNRPVLGIIGEGASLYGIQALWTAAHYRIPVTWVICNNSQYNILKLGARKMGLPRANEGRYESLDVGDPEIDIVALAQSLGVQAERISDPDELTHKVRDSLAGDVPRLFDVPILRTP